MYTVKHISPWPAARFAGLVTGVFALIPTGLMILETLGSSSVFNGGSSYDSWVFLWLLLPVIGGGFYFLFTSLMIWLYNVINEKIGGIELELEFVDEGTQIKG